MQRQRIILADSKRLFRIQPVFPYGELQFTSIITYRYSRIPPHNPHDQPMERSASDRPGLKPRRLWLLVLIGENSSAPMSSQEGCNFCEASSLSSGAVIISPLVRSQNLADQFIIKPRDNISRHGTA